MLEDLKIDPRYDGFAFLADTRSLPRLRPHRHIELELNLVERGEITYVVAGRRVRFRKRTLLWMFPSQEHQLVDQSGDARYYVAVFKPDLIRDACRGDDYAPLLRDAVEAGDKVALHTELTTESFDRLSRAIDQLTAGGPDPDLLSREAGFGFGSDFRYEHHDPDWLNAGLRFLLLMAWRMQRGRVGESRAVTLHPAVRKAMVLMTEESDEPESLASLAVQCEVSEAHLSRMFSRQVGVPITRYRNSLRLSRFWDAYRRSTRPSVTAAAYAAGFGSYAQFYKVFHESYRTGPREYLAEAR